MVTRRVLVVAVLAAALAAASGAREGWPTPAAGLTASGDPEIVFTFDDGPNPTTTGKVLDILAEHHIQAIFFLVGAMPSAATWSRAGRCSPACSARVT